jgi:CPA2 family monovalent cation:H+ antiporter-2
VGLALLPERARDLVLAGAIVSILLNPMLFAVLDWYLAKRATGDTAEAAAPAEPAREPIRGTTLDGHVVLIGHGRVGSVVSAGVRQAGVPILFIEENEDVAAKLKEEGYETITGNAASTEIADAANLRNARCLLVAIPDAFEGGQVVAHARAINPSLFIVARSHSDEETEHLKKHGASVVIMGEQEIAKAMLAGIFPSGGSSPVHQPSGR